MTGIVGIVLIAAGVVLLLRAAAELRADLVAKLVNIDCGCGRHRQRLRVAGRPAVVAAPPKPLALAPFNDEIRWWEK